MPAEPNHAAAEPSYLPRRRSCLSVPATSERKLQKANTLGVDEVVIDIEDSVSVGMKAQGLACAVETLNAWRTPGPTISVRVNPPRSRWCHLELAALAAAEGPLSSVIVPKVESAGDLAFVDRLLDGAESAAGRPRPLSIQVLIETAAGLARVDEIAGSSPRLRALILGYADLAASLGRPASSAGQLELWQGAQSAVLVAARANDLQAIDGPFLGTAADEQFRDAARRARDLGFDGKWAIHPSQVPVLNDLFTPTDVEVQHAHAVIAALSRSEAEQGAGAVKLNDQMIDEAVRQSALRVLTRAPRERS